MGNQKTSIDRKEFFMLLDGITPQRIQKTQNLHLYFLKELKMPFVTAKEGPPNH